MLQSHSSIPDLSNPKLYSVHEALSPQRDDFNVNNIYTPIHIYVHICIKHIHMCIYKHI